MKKQANKIGTVIGTIICIILVPILIINCILIIKSYTNKDEIASLSGVFPLIVLTDSMDPKIQSGDLIICHTAKANQIQKGDIISFYDPVGNGTSVVTHRVTQVTKDEQGKLAWKTKGDANNIEDQALVPADNLVGVYQTRLAGLGNVAMFMQSTQGLIICVMCPILLLVLYDVLKRRKYDAARKQDTDALLAELEALKKEKGDI